MNDAEFDALMAESEKVLAESARARSRRPRWLPLLACALELTMLAIFAVNRSLAGALVWLAYLWFSATWACFRGAFDGDSNG